MRYIIFFLLMLFCVSACASEGYSTSRRKASQRYTQAQAQKNKRDAVQARRDRILKNGNINNFYPKRFRVDWIIINNKAYMALQWGGRNG